MEIRQCWRRQRQVNNVSGVEGDRENTVGGVEVTDTGQRSEWCGR